MNGFASIKIGTRLILLTLMSAFGFSIIVGFVLWEKWGAVNEARQTELRSLIQSAVAVADAFNRQAKDGLLTPQEAQARAKAHIGMMRYRGGEYFWINDFASKMIMHPIKPQLNGQDLSGFKDPKQAPGT